MNHPLDRIVCSTSQIAALFGLTAERVRQLAAAGHFERSGRGRIAVMQAVQGYLKFLRDEARVGSKSAATSRVQDARAREIDLKIAERDGRLIDVVEHRDLFAECFGIIKTGLDGTPARLTRDQTFRRKIETEIDDVLRRAADRFEQAAANAAPAGQHSEADGGDDA